MNSNLPNVDEWYDEYVEASVKQQYQMLLDIMEQPLSKEFIEETEMGELLISMSDELQTNNLKEEALTLIELVRDRQSKFYKKEFSFYDKFLVEYYLYTKQDNLLVDALARFKKYPGNDLEQLFVVVDLLTFYDKPEIAVDLCQATYNSVKNNSDAIDGVEDELGWVVVNHLLEKAYLEHTAGSEIDWQKLTNRLAIYEYDSNQEWLEDVKSALTTKFNSELFSNLIKQKKQHSRAFYLLSTAFCIYMKQEKQMSFVCSQGIWEAMFDFLGDRELSWNQKSNPNRFFTFTKSEIEPYLARKIHGFFSLHQARGYTALWGLPYLYDFLLAKGIIREQLHSKIIDITDKLKIELIEAHQDNWDLWRYDFVNRWQPDNNRKNAELNKLTAAFTNSFNKSEPLSDEPGAGKVESFFDEMADKLGIDFDEIKGKLAEEEAEELETEITEETAPKVKKQKSKKKKSNLGLAAKLYGK